VEVVVDVDRYFEMVGEVVVWWFLLFEVWIDGFEKVDLVFFGLDFSPYFKVMLVSIFFIFVIFYLKVEVEVVVVFF
jgi:hypothetical protein